MKYLSIILSLFGLLLFGCKEVNSKAEKGVREFVKEWNDNHTPIKAPYLMRHYMDVVIYYEKERTKNQVQQDKELLFQQFPDYTQRILNNQMDITKEAGTFLVKFKLQVNYNGVEAKYETYLSVISKNGEFKILREGLTKNNKNLDAPIFPNARDANVLISNNRNRQLFGDFNGDGLSDYASVISPELKASSNTDPTNSDASACNGACNSVIVFSNKDLKAITVKGAYKSQLENLKDLNSDGADEIGFWDIKPTTKSLYVFDAVNNKLLCEPIVINTSVHKNLKLIDVFKKTGPNRITITYSAQNNGKWVLKNQVIRLD